MHELDDIAVVIALHKVTDAKLRLSENYDIVQLLDKASPKEDRDRSTNYYFTSDTWWEETAKGTGVTNLFPFFETLQTSEYAYVQIDNEAIDDIEVWGDPHRYGLDLSKKIVKTPTYDPPTIEQLEE